MPISFVSGTLTQIARNFGAGQSLVNRRVWYADAPPTQPTPPQAPAPDSADAEIDIETLPDNAKALFKKLLEDKRQANAEAKRKGDALTAAEKARIAAEQAALAEQGKWKELAEARAAQLESATQAATQAEAFAKHIAEQNQRRIAAIPEAMRPLVPDFGDPLKTSAWLDANNALLSVRTPPSTNAGERGITNQPNRIPDDLAETAKLFNVPIEKVTAQFLKDNPKP